MSKNPATHIGEYDDQSITSLKGAERVRRRPAVIFGSDGLEGCEHSFFEILANSVDEARAGYGKRIITTVYRDHSLEVEDFGRGIPLGYNEKEGRYNWELIFCEMYAGGKYDNNKSGASYKFSLGLNGLGACATQYASSYLTVRSYSKGQLSEISFKKGEPDSELSVRPTEAKEKKSGTVIRWLPDLEVFTDIAIPYEYFTEILRRQAVANAGITFILRKEEENGKFTETSYCYEHGLIDYISEITAGNALTEPVSWTMKARGQDREDKPIYDLEAELVFCLSNVTATAEYYHNSSYLEYGGSPADAVKFGFTYALDAYLKAKGKYNKNESKVTFTDIAESLVIIINSSSTEASYENQTKKAVNNAFIRTALLDFIKRNLEIYFAEHATEAEIFANQILVNKRAREKAAAAQIDIKKKISGTMDMANRVEKFVGCRSKDPTRRELYIVEGDSALSSCKTSRDAEFQAIIPVRGKTLNCLKSSYAQIFDSPIICDLLRVIGCGVEIEGKKIKGDMVAFNINNLRWSKIIICTDADVDGFQIRALLLTLFYCLLPTLIREGRVFIAESPLYEITYGNGQIEFAYNEAEKNAILEKIGDKKYTLQRSKGLGENEPKMMRQTTMSPATRRLIAVSPADAEETAYIFNTLLGNDLDERKQFIAENGYKYIKDADI